MIVSVERRVNCLVVADCMEFKLFSVGRVLLYTVFLFFYLPPNPMNRPLGMFVMFAICLICVAIS